MAMWMARRFTGLTLRQIGDAGGNRDYAATAMAIRRFQSRLENDQSLAGQTRELSKMLHVDSAEKPSAAMPPRLAEPVFRRRVAVRGRPVPTALRGARAVCAGYIS